MSMCLICFEAVLPEQKKFCCPYCLKRTGDKKEPWCIHETCWLQWANNSNCLVCKEELVGRVPDIPVVSMLCWLLFFYICFLGLYSLSYVFAWFIIYSTP